MQRHPCLGSRRAHSPKPRWVVCRLALLCASAGSLVVAFDASESGAASATKGDIVRSDSASASAFLGGYAVTPPNGFASASATFVVPKINCVGQSFTQQALGVSNGFPASVRSAISLECNPSPTYEFDAAVNGEIVIEEGVEPGDTVVTSLFQTGATEEAEIHDLTNGEYWFASNSPVGDTSIDIGSTATIPVESFAKVTFSNVQVNGDFLSFESPTRFNQLNGGNILVKTSAIASPGDAFSVKFKRSS